MFLYLNAGGVQGVLARGLATYIDDNRETLFTGDYVSTETDYHEELNR